jgi:hypothetical protein
MKPGRIRTFALLLGAIPPSFSKDLLLVTTNWNHPGNEQVLLIDPESGRVRTLWNRGTELDAVVAPDANYAAGSSEYSLLRFDTQENLFVSEEQAISNCPGPHPLPVPGEGKVLVLCRGGTATPASDGERVLRLEHCQNYSLGRRGNEYMLYAAARGGRIQAVDVTTREVVHISKDAPYCYRRVMPSSGTISPDGRLWYVPIKIPNDGEQGMEQILVFDTQTMSMATVITPDGPFWGLALSSDGRQLYASQDDLQNIMVIDTATRRTVRVIDVGAKPSILLAVNAP